MIRYDMIQSKSDDTEKMMRVKRCESQYVYVCRRKRGYVAGAGELGGKEI